MNAYKVKIEGRVWQGYAPRASVAVGKAMHYFDIKLKPEQTVTISLTRTKQSGEQNEIN